MARPDDRLLGTPQTAQEGTDEIIRSQQVRDPLRLVTYNEAIRAQAEAVFRQRGRDHKLSWCDTISFVVVTRLLDDIACFSFDRDFKQLGLTVLS